MTPDRRITDRQPPQGSVIVAAGGVIIGVHGGQRTLRP